MDLYLPDRLPTSRSPSLGNRWRAAVAHQPARCRRRLPYRSRSSGTRTGHTAGTTVSQAVATPKPHRSRRSFTNHPTATVDTGTCVATRPFPVVTTVHHRRPSRHDCRPVVTTATPGRHHRCSYHDHQGRRAWHQRYGASARDRHQHQRHAGPRCSLWCDRYLAHQHRQEAGSGISPSC